MSFAIAAVAIFVIAFLLGSIPWGLIFSKVLFKEDVREHGSGNIGTTNMIRTYGKKVGISVFVLDFAKGLLAGFVALWIGQALAASGGTDATGQDILLTVSFWGCTWGHIFCPWLGFKGGKGIAVSIGCLFVVFGPVMAFVQLMIFVILVPTTRYVSLGSMACAVGCPFIALYAFWGNPWAVICCTLGAIMVFWAHRSNLQRLLAGTERRIGDKKEK